jgi:hypothetical protein
MVTGQPVTTAHGVVGPNVWAPASMAFGHLKNLKTLKLVTSKHKSNPLHTEGALTACEIDLKLWFESLKEKDPTVSVPEIEIAPVPLKSTIPASDMKRLNYHLVPVH